MNEISDEELLIVDDKHSNEWNYVERVEHELAFCDDFKSVLVNKCLPRSYKEVLGVVGRGSNSSRTSLLLDDTESTVAFVVVVDEEAIPFMLDCMEDVFVPVNAVFKVFYDDDVAFSKDNVLLNEFILDTVIPDLNENILLWNKFKQEEESV